MEHDLSQLTADLASGNPHQRAEAAKRLARLGRDARAAAVPLVRATAEVEPVREWAVAALEELGAPDREEVAALAGLLREQSSEDVLYWAATLLGRLGPNAEAATADLANTLADGVPLPARQRAAWALGKIGPAAKAAKPQLEQAALSQDDRLARLAARALEAVTG